MSGAGNGIKKLAPLLDRVLVEKLSPAQKTTGGVLLPEQASSKTVEGNVLAVGPGRLSSDGSRLPMSAPLPLLACSAS
jgi:co-chaperonin GroES (HSP10)